ncbi:MAG: type I DNA topoisomerase [Bacillota bacterium]
MSKVLVIVESPAKAKTIGRFLGRKYIVRSSMGHVRDLPKSQLGVNVEEGFEPKYITIRGKGDILKELRKAAKGSSRILLAPDPDREGEAIAWHLQHILEIEPTEACRIEFNEITKTAVENAVKSPRPIDQDRVNAQQARRVLDRLVGYNLSPLLWRKVRKGLSAGRVQSVAVRLIVDRETEIEEFVPEEYWSLTATLTPPGVKKSSFDAKLFKKNNQSLSINDQETMDQVLAYLKGLPFQVVKVQKKEKKRNPSPPFTTSSMQQDAYRQLNFTARRTMRVAQQLYEGIDMGKGQGSVGLISYIRTDSTRVADIAIQEVRDFIGERYGETYVPEKPRQYAVGKQAQNAHEAIRPTSVLREPSQLKGLLSSDQLRLYRLIWERFLASQMSAAVSDTTTVDIAAGDYLFRATGSILKFPGFTQVYREGRDEQDKDEEEGMLPDLQEDTALELLKFDPRQHFTQPPPRYSEATLVKTLEEKGIGRPSTYAPIIETIISRGYVARENKQFYPTELGIIVLDLLKEYFTDVINVEFTANMETKLDMIEEGELTWRKVIADFFRPFQVVLEHAEEEIGEVEVKDEESDEKCEKCGRNLVIKTGRYGKFLACPGFPECRNTKPIFEDIGISCPSCDGKIILRRSKKGRKFYGCSNFPRCEYISWDKPTEEVCPKCSARLVEKTSGKSGTRVVCPTKGCTFEGLASKAK